MAYDIFVITFTQLCDMNCPVKKICSNIGVTKYKPWLNTNCLKPTIKEVEYRYIKSKNKLNSVLRFSEKMYYNKLLEREKTISKILGQF